MTEKSAFRVPERTTEDNAQAKIYEEIMKVVVPIMLTAPIKAGGNPDDVLAIANGLLTTAIAAYTRPGMEDRVLRAVVRQAKIDIPKKREELERARVMMEKATPEK